MKYGRRACLVVGPRVALEPSANCSTACLFDLPVSCCLCVVLQQIDSAGCTQTLLARTRQLVQWALLAH